MLKNVHYFSICLLFPFIGILLTSIIKKNILNEHMVLLLLIFTIFSLITNLLYMNNSITSENINNVKPFYVLLIIYIVFFGCFFIGYIKLWKTYDNIYYNEQSSSNKISPESIQIQLENIITLSDLEEQLHRRGPNETEMITSEVLI